MKKRYRFLLIDRAHRGRFLFRLAFHQVVFPDAAGDKDMAESSRNQIKVYAQEQADEAIKQLVALGEQAPLPAEYSFLVAKATVRYQTAKHSPPSSGRCRTCCRPTRAGRISQPTSRTGTAHRCSPSRTSRTRPCSSVSTCAAACTSPSRWTTPAWRATSGTRLTDAQKDDKMKTTLEVLRNKIDQFGLTDPSIRRQGTDKIIIEIPGTSDPETVRRFIMGKGLAHVPYRWTRTRCRRSRSTRPRTPACSWTPRATSRTPACSPSSPRATCCAACSRRTPTAWTS